MSQSRFRPRARCRRGVAVIGVLALIASGIAHAGEVASSPPAPAAGPAAGSAAGTAAGTATPEARDELSDAASALKDYAARQRDEAIAEAARLMAVMDERIAELKQSASAGADDALRELELRRAAAAKRLEQLSAASASAWDEVRQGFVGAWQELKAAYEERRAEAAAERR